MFIHLLTADKPDENLGDRTENWERNYQPTVGKPEPASKPSPRTKDRNESPAGTLLTRK